VLCNVKQMGSTDMRSSKSWIADREMALGRLGLLVALSGLAACSAILDTDDLVGGTEDIRVDLKQDAAPADAKVDMAKDAGSDKGVGDKGVGDKGVGDKGVGDKGVADKGPPDGLVSDGAAKDGLAKDGPDQGPAIDGPKDGPLTDGPKDGSIAQ
jgi:hypothetical protein